MAHNHKINIIMSNIISISSSHRQVGVTIIVFLDNKGNIKLKDPGWVSSCIHKRQKILKSVSPKDVCLFAHFDKCVILTNSYTKHYGFLHPIVVSNIEP